MSLADDEGMSLTIAPSPVITVLQAGPCWCRRGDGAEGSFDLMRYRLSDPVPGLSRNLLIVTDRIVTGSRASVMHTYQSIPDPKLVVATSACPAARQFWEELSGGWTPLEEAIRADAHVASCISGRPEALLAAVIEALWQTSSESAPAAIVGLEEARA